MVAARKASQAGLAMKPTKKPSREFDSEEEALDIPPWQLSGAGSSSKVLYTLGAPVTLNGSTPSVNTAPLDLPPAARPMSAIRRNSTDTGPGLFATLRKGSLAFPSSHRSHLPDSFKVITTDRSPSKGRKGRHRSALARRMSHSGDDSADDDDDFDDDLTADPYGHAGVVVVDMPTPSRSPPPTGAMRKLVSSPILRAQQTDYALQRQHSHSSTKTDGTVRASRDVLRARAASTASVPKASPIPSALDGSIIKSPSFVNGDATMIGQPKSDEQIEEIVPWMFERPQSAKDGQSSPRSRQTSFSPSSGNRSQPLRNAKSSSALKSNSSRDASTSPDKKSKGKSFLGLLRRKPSTADGLKAGASGDFGADSPFSNPFIDSKPGARPPSAHAPNDKSKTKKGAKGGRTREASNGTGTVNAAGVQLDTNLDRMEGIVAPDTLINGTAETLLEGVVPLAARRRLSGLPATGLGLGSDVDPVGNRIPRPESASSGSQHIQDPIYRGPSDRRGSAFSLGLPGIAPSISSNSGPANPANGGFAPGAVWTAPDSWGVHGELNTEVHSDSEGSEDGSESIRGNVSMNGTHAPNTPLLNVAENDRANGRPGSAGGRLNGAPPGRRPGTATSVVHANLAAMATSKMMPNSSVRIYKTDGTHTVMICPLNVTAGELQLQVAKKPGFAPSKGIHRLFARERGLERSLLASEKPLMLQRRRFEQAGYIEADKLEDIGREDHSYLIRFIFKPETGPVANSDDDQLDGFESVNLDARGLQTIPIFLYRHAHELVTLNVSRNPRLELPSDFVQACSSLREMRMIQMGIKRVPQSIRQASGLTRLDVSNNRIIELDHVALDELTELLSLKISNNRLYHLPDYFGRFNCLKYLVISNNKFEALPVSVCEIPSLIDLDVSFNSLTGLPDVISKLVNLERLILFGNDITSLPSTFGELSRLREVDCRRNNITSFAVLNELKSLEVARLQHNAASAIDGRLPCVRYFNASHNPLTKFDFTGMAATLTTLNLMNAKLSALPSEMFSASLTALEILILDNNSLRSLPDAIGNCSALIHLSCKGNRIDSVPPSIGKLERLQDFDVSNNDVHTLAAEIWHCGELVSLNVSSNLLSEFPDPPQLAALEEPIIEDERKASIASQRSGNRVAAAAAASLQRLLLADNRLPDETFHPISLMSELRVLNLSFNELYEIPARILAKSTQLEELYLSGNMLTTLPEEDMARLSNLRVLHLNGNKLQTLPAELGQLKKLRVLDVGCNVLKYNIANWKFDWNWNWNTELKYLNLSGNKRLEIKPAGPQAMHGMDDSPSTTKKRRNLSDFGAMKKLRVLGLMDVTLTISSVPEDSEDRRVRTSLPEINNMGYGIADILGQTEELTMVDMVVRRFRGRDDECIFGMFDGRPRARGIVVNSGSRIAKYLQDCFASSLSVEISRTARAKAQLAASGADPEDLPSAAEDANESLRRTFLNLNRDYGNILLPFFDARRKDSDMPSNSASFSLAAGSSSDARSGATAVVVYVQGRTMHVANAGDALAVMASRGGAARLMSVKHDPQAPEEVARIRASEGFVSAKGLVNDEVDVSRSFGHYHVFPTMNALPQVTTIELSEDDEFIIIGSKGLWDYMTYQAAVDCARKERADPMAAAQKLRDLAIGYGSSESMMVMVVAVGDLFKTKQGPVVARGKSIDAGDTEIYAGQKLARRGHQAAGPGERYLTLLDREVAPPVGSVALVFTDIRNSTAQWEVNPGVMQIAMRMHNQLLRRQLRAIGGYEVKTEGDAFMVSFPTVTSALLWCFTVQIELLREDWPQTLLDSEEGREIYAQNGELLYRGLSVRMGIHWGQPVCEADPITRRMDYFGPVVNRASRISGVAEGGQISCSADALDAIKLLCGLDDTHVHDEEDANDFEATLAADPELDEGTKRDVLVIRKLGVGITELGERRLKGLETPESLFLLYPSQLAGRLKPAASENTGLLSPTDDGLPGASNLAGARGAEMFAPLPQLLDAYQMNHMGHLILRMETALNLILHPADPSTSPALSQHSPHTNRSGAMGSRKRIHPFLLRLPIPLETSDEELVTIFENFVARLENLLASLQLYQLGPYNQVLSVLSGATQIDSRQILQALSMFASVMGQSGQPNL